MSAPFHTHTRAPEVCTSSCRSASLSTLAIVSLKFQPFEWVWRCLKRVIIDSTNEQTPRAHQPSESPSSFPAFPHPTSRQYLGAGRGQSQPMYTLWVDRCLSASVPRTELAGSFLCLGPSQMPSPLGKELAWSPQVKRGGTGFQLGSYLLSHPKQRACLSLLGLL